MGLITSGQLLHLTLKLQSYKFTKYQETADLLYKQSPPPISPGSRTPFNVLIYEILSSVHVNANPEVLGRECIYVFARPQDYVRVLLDSTDTYYAAASLQSNENNTLQTTTATLQEKDPQDETEALAFLLKFNAAQRGTYSLSVFICICHSNGNKILVRRDFLLEFPAEPIELHMTITSKPDAGPSDSPSALTQLSLLVLKPQQDKVQDSNINGYKSIKDQIITILKYSIPLEDESGNSQTLLFIKVAAFGKLFLRGI